MPGKQFFITLLALAVTLTGLTACTLDLGARIPVSVETMGTPSSEGLHRPRESGDGLIESLTPTVDEELSIQFPEQTDPSAATENGEVQMDNKLDGENSHTDTLVVYVDNTYQFTIAYPTNFVFRTFSTEQLAQFTPVPSAAFRIMSPAIAASDLGEAELADLELHIFGVQDVRSLDHLLTSLGLESAKYEPFQTDRVSGIEICASTMIAPGCSYFVASDSWIYRLIPATLEGESLIDTFEVLP